MIMRQKSNSKKKMRAVQEKKKVDHTKATEKKIHLQKKIYSRVPQTHIHSHAGIKSKASKKKVLRRHIKIYFSTSCTQEKKSRRGRKKITAHNFGLDADKTETFSTIKNKRGTIIKKIIIMRQSWRWAAVVTANGSSLRLEFPWDA